MCFREILERYFYFQNCNSDSVLGCCCQYLRTYHHTFRFLIMLHPLPGLLRIVIYSVLKWKQFNLPYIFILHENLMQMCSAPRHLISSDSCRPCGWEMLRVLSPAALLSSCRLLPTASSMKSVHLLVHPPPFLLLSIFPALLSFQESQPSQNAPEVGQVQSCSYFPYSFPFFSSQNLSLVCFPGQYNRAKNIQWSSQMNVPNEAFKFYFISHSNQVYFMSVFPLYFFLLNRKDREQEIHNI